MGQTKQTLQRVLAFKIADFDYRRVERRDFVVAQQLIDAVRSWDRQNAARVERKFNEWLDVAEEMSKSIIDRGPSVEVTTFESFEILLRPMQWFIVEECYDTHQVLGRVLARSPHEAMLEAKRLFPEIFYLKVSPL
jgi:hypothetical protein